MTNNYLRYYQPLDWTNNDFQDILDELNACSEGQTFAVGESESA